MGGKFSAYRRTLRLEAARRGYSLEARKVNILILNRAINARLVMEAEAHSK